ncbi:MAG: hypothetical protein ACI8RD_004239 [Bacillariaceae sp.]|jgi:hypothetical protein
MMTEQHDDSVDVLMPPPSPNEAAKEDVNVSAKSSTTSQTQTSTTNSGTTGTTGTSSTTTAAASGTAAANIELLKSTTTNIVQSVTTGIQEHIIRPKSKAYIWHRINGTARPYPIQVQQNQKQRMHGRGSSNDEQNDINDDNSNNNNNNNVCDCNNCDCEQCNEQQQKQQHYDNRKPPCFACYAPPCVYHCANIVEQNRFCDSFGMIGCFGHDDFYIRRRILIWGFLANCISLVLSIIACLSISLNYNLIQIASFTRGIIYLPNIDLPLTQIWIGLRGVAIHHYQGQVKLLNITGSTAGVSNAFDGEDNYVIKFNDICNLIADKNGTELYTTDPDSCDACANASNGLVSAVVLSTLLILPNLTTDILRMYPNYDLNCQKFFGSVLSLCSMLGSLYAWRGYAGSCYRSFNTDIASMTVPFFMNGTIDSESISDVNDPLMEFLNNKTTIDVAFDWKAGTGLICIAFATFLKVVDIIAIWLIPTPDIAHTRQLQDEYEQLYGNDSNKNDDDNVAIDVEVEVEVEC